jgi:hypothetical protein
MTTAKVPLKITAIGGSATRGLNIAQQDTWPEQLQIVCQEADWHVFVENRASHGLSLSGFVERVLHIEREDPQDLYLFQIPGASRSYIGVNGTRRIREECYGKQIVFGWSALSGGVTPTRLNLTKGISDENSPFHRYLKNYAFPIVSRNNRSVTYEEFVAFVRFWESNICRSDLELISYAKEIFLLQQILRNLKKSYLMFQWHGECLRKLAHRTDPFYGLIDWTKFARNGEKTVIDYLQESYADQYPGLLNDEYHHLNRAGNRIIAEEIVFQEICRYNPSLPGTAGPLTDIPQ